MRYPQVLIALIVVFGWGINSYAAFVERDSGFGPASITYDSLTELEWLDVTQTTNMSVLDVEAATEYGGTYHGWRYATTENLENLFFVSAGFPPNEYAYPEDAPLYQEFLRLFGVTADSVAPGCYLCIHAVFGFTATETDWNWREIATVQIEWAEGAVIDMFADVDGGAGNINFGSEIAGHWLVRDANSAPGERTSWGALKSLYK